MEQRELTHDQPADQPADAAPSPWLTGAWEPIHDEIVAGDLAVTGVIPPQIRGDYVRNGPNPAFDPPGRYHIFDGDGMLHGVRFEDGQASYRNRWVDSAGLRAERRAGGPLYGGLNEFRMPPQEVLAEAGPLKNTANTHVWRHAGRAFALLEATRPTEFDLDLNTIGEYDFDGLLQGPMTAHPKTDPETGELIFFGYSPFPPFIRYHVADPAGRLVTSVPIDLPRAVMMHDFAVSRDHVVFFDLPAVFDVKALVEGKPGIRWEPEHGARIGVLRRSEPTSPVRWFEMEPFWMFHVLNAHDDGDAVVVEACRTTKLNAEFGEEDFEPAPPPTLHRWRLDLASGAVSEEQVDDRPTDFPRVNDDLAGLNTRYGYAGHTRRWDDGSVEFSGITKYDLHGGTSSAHDFGPREVGGEAAFVPDPERSDDDAGWLMTYVTDLAAGSSDLVIVDAQTMEQTARVHLPRRVPSGFHGNWFAHGAQGNNRTVGI
ncbi:MAG: carotenoid oxygenase family protein [Acidimicrobiales bacterium]|nr:carotenoid oxygenase family protein [Acidimicrobiales bacterium]